MTLSFCLQVLADDDTKVQLTQEVGDLKTAAEVSKALDEKLVWLDGFNKQIIEYDKICKELEEIVVKDRKELDALIKPEAAFKATDRLVSAMDLADDIRSQIEIANNKQQLWDQGLSPEGKENTPEVLRCLLIFKIESLIELIVGPRIREENDCCIREACSS